VSKTYPLAIRVGAAAGKIYRTRNSASASGFLFEAWAGSVKVKSGTDDSAVEKELRLYLSKVNAGEVEAAGFRKEDRDELYEARRIAHPTPVLAALREWKELKEKLASKLSCTPKDVSEARDLFIAQGDKAGGSYSRTYGSKLSHLSEAFPSRYIHTITAIEMNAYFEQWEHPVTRGDIRKRTISLWKWAQRMGFIPRGDELAPALTTNPPQTATIVGVIKPDVFAKLLMYIQDYHPEYLGALVLAGFFPMRVSEIHGSRDHHDERQTWADVHEAPDGKEPPFLNVTAAKPNTPDWRRIPIPPVALKWLKVVDRSDSGYVCDHNALDKVRAIARAQGLELAENGFRHSVISYSLAIHKDKARIALDGGTSVQIIDKNYRRPVPLVDATTWFKLTPKYCRDNFEPLKQLSHAEISRLGGQSRSPAKLAAAMQNLNLTDSTQSGAPKAS
jgi:hypothetical protein